MGFAAKLRKKVKTQTKKTYEKERKKKELTLWGALGSSPDPENFHRNKKSIEGGQQLPQREAFRDDKKSKEKREG